MITVYNCLYCSLRVRVSNRAAISLYQDVLGYKIRDTEYGYYADKEDAYDMRVTFELPSCCPGHDHGHDHGQTHAPHQIQQ